MTEDKTRALVKAQEGNSEAFEELILLSEKMVYNLAYRMMGNESDALDMSQEAYIKAFKGIKRFDGKSSFSTWIYRITVNTCLDELRRRKNKETISLDAEVELPEGGLNRQVASSEENPEEKLLKKEKGALVLDAIEKLSSEHKTAIVLRDIEGLGYEEIAQITGVSLGTVKSRLSRARFRLRELIGSEPELCLKTI